MIRYGYVREFDTQIDEVLEKLPGILDREGFGILSKVDLSEKFRDILGVDHKRYVIVGVCDPANALRAIRAEENIGLLLPCNILVYERDGGGTVVASVKPSVVMEVVGNDDLSAIGKFIETKLRAVVDTL